MFKLMGKEINAILGAHIIDSWTYEIISSPPLAMKEGITVCMLGNFERFFVCKIYFFKKLIQDYQHSIKQFGPISGLTLCQF